MSEFVVGAVYDLNGAMSYDSVEIVRKVEPGLYEIRWFNEDDSHINEWTQNGFILHILNDPRVKMNEVSLAKRIIASYE